MIRIILEAIYDDYLQAKYANYEQRRDDLTSLESYARTFEAPVDFLSQLSLMATAETESIRGPDQETERITLSTIHQAKGLEWRAVFVIWLTDGMFPSSRSLESVDSIEEERRLFYVAVTRAKDELYLTYPAYWPGGSVDNRLQRPSRFLKEIPHDLVEEWSGVSVTPGVENHGDKPFLPVLRCAHQFCESLHPCHLCPPCGNSVQ